MQGPDDDAQGGRGAAPDDAPYTVYGGRSGRRGRSAAPRDDRPRDPRGGGEGSRGPADGGRPADPDGPGYTVYAARRGPRRGAGAGADGGDDPDPRRRRRLLGRRPGRGGSRSLGRRLVRGLLLFVVGWIALSLVLFLVSATIHQEGGDVDELLGGGGAPFSPTNLLILGTDARPKDSKEPGAEGGGGATRTDTMLLLRTGGLKNAKLSIPRDTAVDIEGQGRRKINSAYAFGGTSGSVAAVETLTDVDVNHVATIDFQNFPSLIDAMGGVRYTAKTCLTADVSGGAKRPRAGVTIGYDKNLGGTSFRLEEGETYTLKGSAALALARVRKNRCDAAQDDVNRAGRQQEIVGAMKRRMLSPTGFLRMPLVAWKAPQAVRSDMSGPTLLGVALAQFLPGGGSNAVLKPTGVETLVDGSALSVSPEAVARARRRFEK